MARRQTPINRHVQDVIGKYAQTLREYDIHVAQVFLFGSHAKGNAHEGSDIDLAIISADFGHDYCGERVRLMQLARKTSNLIEPHPLRPEDLFDRWSTLAGEIREHGIAVG